MLLSHFKVGKVRSGIVSILVCLICAFSSTHALTQSSLPQQIRIGTRIAAFPLGRVYANGQIGGFCGEIFQDGLRQELLKRGIQSSVSNQRIKNQYKGAKFPRYNGLLKQEIEIECGTNSPLSGDLLDNSTGKYFRDEITFSDSFYQSGTKLLLKIDQAKKLNDLPANEQESEIYKLRIGVIQNTTTLKQFQEKGKDFTSYPTREEALDSLDTGRSLEAFATDALIVQTLLEEGVKGDDLEKDRPPYKDREFILFPLKARAYLPGLDEEKFAIAIKKNTPYERELLSVINATLNTIQNKNGFANYEKDYQIPEARSQATAKSSTSSSSGIDSSTPGLIVLGIAALGVMGIFAIVILALAKGNIFHQHGSGDNVAGDKVRRDKINNRDNDS
jgi:polar amino acid transport system substrate-binding protein